ncbi:ABC transporter permease [Paenibacillus sp. alder61]|uniref:ABC transporter permease n=1 Tax=Paenibacillus TaxID=44249 RepID=UPI001BCA88B5|nr:MULTISPECIES: ABC transporter permease [Paenibacillus]MCA1292768.1 ABC transporter permease [Paenibacillus sp. alder61]
MKSLFRSKETGILAVLLFLCVVLSVINPVFLTGGNLHDIFKANVVLAILAMGMTLVIITGGIDVSVAAVTSASIVITGHLMAKLPDSPWSVLIAFAVSILCGIVFGLLNGLLISRVKIPPIVATLGMMSVINGSILYFTNGMYMNSSNFPAAFIRFSDLKIAGISILVYLMLIITVLTWYVMKHTKIGRSVFAIGGNPVSAVRAGISLERTQMFVYGYVGFMAGVAAMAQTMYTKSVDPNGMLGFEMTVISAVVIGGANILGGSGSAWGTFLGVLLLGVMQNGLILTHIDTYWQKIVVGIVILTAVSYDVIQRKRAESKLMKVEVQE